MAGLVLSSGQIAVINASDTDIDAAFSSGVVDVSQAVAVPALTGYSALSDTLKPVVREPFKMTLAVIMSRLNIPGALPTGLSATVALAKLTSGGTNGSMTFVNGILTAVTAPT